MRLKLALALTASFAAIPTAASADDAAQARGIYVGVFGGVGSGSDTDVTQRGTVYFMEAMGGPLAVNATGQADGDDVSFFGGHIGFELANGSAVLPAFEVEGIQLDTGTRLATLDNSNVRGVEESFDDSFSADNTVFLANLVLSFPTSFHGVTPYAGGGIGAARVSVDGATSIQTDPAEPGINHFNSGVDATAWTFAAQAKAGLRVALASNIYAFGEYRYVYVGATDLTFGSTMDLTHSVTSEWTVKLDDAPMHLASAGIGFSF